MMKCFICSPYFVLKFRELQLLRTFRIELRKLTVQCRLWLYCVANVEKNSVRVIRLNVARQTQTSQSICHSTKMSELIELI